MAEMTAEQRVKAQRPHANAYQEAGGTWSVALDHICTLGYMGRTVGWHESPDNAWEAALTFLDAASRLPEQPAPVADAQELPPYRVGVDTQGCKTCGNGSSWAVIRQSDDSMLSRTYGFCEDAIWMADQLCRAYAEGQQAVIASHPHEQPLPAPPVQTQGESQ